MTTALGRLLDRRDNLTAYDAAYVVLTSAQIIGNGAARGRVIPRGPTPV